MQVWFWELEWVLSRCPSVLGLLQGSAVRGPSCPDVMPVFESRARRERSGPLKSSVSVGSEHRHPVEKGHLFPVYLSKEN